MTATPQPILVTGGAGFIGCNLADRLASAGHEVRVFDLLARPGVETNLAWLTARHGDRIVPMIEDIRDEAAVREATQGVAAVFHLAAQVAVTTSMAAPGLDFDTNLRGTINVLEALRRQSAPPPMVFASTNKVYGALDDVPLRNDGHAYVPTDPALHAAGFGEDRPLSFQTPYGCSKGAADQYVLDYARSFAVPTCVLRMSCVYGPRQQGTEDQGWLAHFLYSVRDGRQITVFGDGHQVRDVLFVDDAVAAYLAAWTRIDRVAGRAFNLGGGPANAVTLLDVLDELRDVTGRTPVIRFEDWRPGDQRYFVADPARAISELGLSAFVPWREGMRRMAADARAARATMLETAGDAA